ncbi:MAG: YkgJ family cysteine cluster protein [Nitrospirae bacterium]|nr:MAG: YkgJ family cysteine cluster protein [Nitrospirota bacterium]
MSRRPQAEAEAAAREAALQEKCRTCPGQICCTYLTQEIPTPRSKLDFDNLLWSVAHEGVEVFKDEGTWYLLIQARCRHLRPDGGCAIYATRPQACRDYSAEYCERDAPAEAGFELHFPDYDSLLAYCRRRFRRWDG